jgi:hypothetical protein
VLYKGLNRCEVLRIWTVRREAQGYIGGIATSELPLYDLRTCLGSIVFSQEWSTLTIQLQSIITIMMIALSGRD